MTDEEIIKLAKKTREEKYCTRFERRYGDCKLKEFPYTRCVMKRTPVCDEWDNLCEGEGYRLGFLDGFKAGYKIGFDEGHDEGFMEARLGEDW